MKFHLIVVMVFGFSLMPILSAAVKIDAGDKTEAELNSDMVLRCQYQMGEFGSAGFDVCIKSERAARTALADYPDEFEDIIRRCYRTVGKGGWDMVKRCSDADAAAGDALQ